MVLPDDLRDEIRTLLQERRREAVELLDSLAKQFDEVVDATVNSNVDDEHDPEGMTIAFERSQVSAVTQRAQDDLAEIEAALARVEDPDFGVCTGCGRTIPVERLRARPTARTCVSCAARQSR